MEQAAPSRLIVIAGPTASGKTRAAAGLARLIGGEIVSADSRQVYRGMDIGTGKDLADYGTDVPYHLVDIRPAGDRLTLFDWLTEARAALADIRSRGRMPIVCGGTGLYLEALVKGYDVPPAPCDHNLRASLADKPLDELTAMLAAMKPLHNTTDTDTTRRAIRAIEIARAAALPGRDKPQPEAGARVFAIDIPVEKRRQAITRRLLDRLDQGLVEEVERLLAEGVSPDTLIYYGLEYRFVARHLLGELTRSEMVGGLETAIHRFAKRQMTWLRGMERRGTPITWLPYDTPDLPRAILSLL